MAAHAGSVPMDERKDALAAAAKFVLKVEEYASRGVIISGNHWKAKGFKCCN